MRKHSGVRELLVCAMLVVSFVAGVRALAQGTSAAVPDHKGYAGDAACAKCHLAQSNMYAATAHHLTSQLPSSTSILGSFSTGSNVLWIADPPPGSDDPRLRFVMAHDAEGYHQTAVADLGDKHLTHTERIDLVFGSGRRGQTYLYWTGDQLSELPVSFWTEGQHWINSPGYKDGTANFSRHADPRCMECHTTYIRAQSPLPDSYRYDPATLVPGISCETCHGPGAEHVALHGDKQHASSPGTPEEILNPARFDRDRQVDACALCHNGTAGVELRPAFSFVPGNVLSNYITAGDQDAQQHLDVHGNQVGLLKRSRCYLDSPNMTCTTCHEVHAPERPAASYSSRCLQCHTWQSCGASRKLGRAIANDCITCHMPLQQTQAIVSVTAGTITRASIRTHWIKVYAPVSGALPAEP